ncbi:MAG: penicillin-binding protein [Flavobacteriaceae bacterium]|nr:penicillin-binding protein [Flavobacteriaceae bacterium]
MSKIKKNIITRLYVVSFFMLVFASSIIFKLIDIQFTNGDYYRELSENRVFKNIEIPANRGNIYSEKGRLLATSVPKYDIRFDALAPTENNFNEYVEELSIKLGENFNKPSEYYIKTLTNARINKNRYLLIARNLGYSEYMKIKNFPLFRLGSFKGGIITEQYTKRDYPIGGVAQRTVGYERYDDFGNVTRPGIDGAFGPKYLKGENGSRLSQKIGKGQWKPVEDFNQKEPRDGYDIYTTINIEIQDVAHFALLEQLEYYEADHGSVIVMETSTGEIRAISNLGRTSEGKYYEKLNYAIGESHEPGSTFKLMAMVAALEDKVVDTSDVIDTRNGVLSFYGRKVRDSKKGGYGKISVAKAFEVSSNTGLVQIVNNGYEKNPEKFIDRIFSMGLNNQLDLELIGEGKPIFTHPSDKKNWDGLDLPWMAFGYGISLTPLQTLTFYNAIANNGKMVKPRFLKEVRSFDNVIETFDTQIINSSICSKETINKVKQMMVNVVEKKHGTAHNIYDKNFSMAGKTGTCQTEYWKNSNLYISSFAGYFPAEDPKYSCIVVIHKPNKTKGYYGNVVAAPVFKKIAQKIYSETPVVQEQKFLNEINILKEDGNDTNPYYMSLNSSIMPDLSKMELMDAIALLENFGMKVIIQGKGKKINQSIKKGKRIKKDQKIILRLS